MKSLSTLILMVFLGTIALVSCNRGDSADKSVITLNSDNFSEETGQGVVLVDFWATWCMPCKAMAPVIHEIAEETRGKVKVGKVDVDQNGELARQFNVQGIPNFIIFKDGKVVESFVGIQPKETLTAALEKYTSAK